MTAVASNVHRFGPALRPREAERAEPGRAQSAASKRRPFHDPFRLDMRWDEGAWWTKQLGHPLDDAA